MATINFITALPVVLLIFALGYLFGLWTASKVHKGEDKDEYPLDGEDPYMSSLYKKRDD